MQVHSEIDRLKCVYRQYGERGWSETKWSVTNRGNVASRRERDQKLRQLLQRAGFFPLHQRRILDVGCGTGEALAGFEEWGARADNLFGVDLLADRVRSAKRKFPELNFQEANAEALPFGCGFFDLVAVFNVFTSVLDPQMTLNLCREIRRVLRSGGAVVWYDLRMNNPLNPNVRGISLRKIRDLFPEFRSRVVSITLLPPLSRRCGALTDLLYPCLASLPFLRSHYLGLLLKV